MPNEAYVFDSCMVDVTERRLVRDGGPVALEPRTFDVLTALVRRAGHLVTKRQLLDEVWADACVEEGILSVHVARLRDALGRDAAGRHIETVSRMGYRLNAAVATYTGPARPVPAHVPAHPQVHPLIGRGRSRVLSASLHEIPKAVAAFEEAIDLDVTYAAAHAGLALARCAQAELRLAPHGEAYAAARSAALRALALDTRCADAHAAMGAVLLMHDWDAVAAERSLERALALNGSHTEALALYGRVMDARGRPTGALGMKMKALERDPDSPFVHMEIALTLWHQRQYHRVLEWTEKTLALDPHHLLARELVTSVHWKRGDFDRHLDEAIAHARSFGVPDEAFADLRRAHACGGRRAVVAYSIEQMSRHPQPAQHVQLALLRGELGEMDLAFGHLDAAIDARDPSLVYLAAAPQWDQLRADVRFDARVERVGLSC